MNWGPKLIWPALGRCSRNTALFSHAHDIAIEQSDILRLIALSFQGENVDDGADPGGSSAHELPVRQVHLGQVTTGGDALSSADGVKNDWYECGKGAELATTGGLADASAVVRCGGAGRQLHSFCGFREMAELLRATQGVVARPPHLAADVDADRPVADSRT